MIASSSATRTRLVDEGAAGGVVSLMCRERDSNPHALAGRGF